MYDRKKLHFCHVTMLYWKRMIRSLPI